MSSERPQPIPGDDAPHILVVDDDNRIRELLIKFLNDHGYRVTPAEDVAQARATLRGFAFDLIILDVMMPGVSGLEFAASLRATSQIPILMLTARTELNDRLAGLELGIDDYLGKPFEPKELLLRMENILRRVSPAGLGEVNIGICSFQVNRGELRRAGELVQLTTGERELLRIFVARRGQAVSRTDLAKVGASSARAVDVAVNRLRQKLEADPKHPIYLQTVRGAGYALHTD
ncbi:MAG: response regulator transcription factor [Alphaproteobacteria bacterium]